MFEQLNPIERPSSHQLKRWARQERSALMAVYLRRAVVFIAVSLRRSMQTLESSHAVRLLSSTCGTPFESFGNLMIAPWRTSACAVATSNPSCAMADQHLRERQE
jgi:hypothetical protein